MSTENRKSNSLINETSPYLLQHAYNPVNWTPWNEEAFKKAEAENKPIFLSIGYSTCHWCHVMERESFEDHEVAKLLNDDFICIKVDKEERPDIDNIYMSVCQMLTGSGGWPLTILMDFSKRPFFAGTYFPKNRKYGTMGLVELLGIIKTKWNTSKSELLDTANQILIHIEKYEQEDSSNESIDPEQLLIQASALLESSFDEEYGGFGTAPKFPTPHNLLFLMEYYKATHHKKWLDMSEKTLLQMYRGGLFDHIGFGFSRYSTDNKWLVPHFEKMLYDNALLIMAYTEAYQITKNELYEEVARKTVHYILRELTHPSGGFYCAQDADSEGVEGKYYVFTPDEIINVLGKESGSKFNEYYDISQSGNFEGKNIPNLIHNNNLTHDMDQFLDGLYEYRKTRTKLHKDDKILTSWNGLMIVALSRASVILSEQSYLNAAIKAEQFISERFNYSGNAFIDDYAFYIYALLELYNTTLDEKYLAQSESVMQKAIDEFFDFDKGGFYLYGKSSEQLILKPKETYDGAIPSGNSVMVLNLHRLALLLNNAIFETVFEKHFTYMLKATVSYSLGNSFLLASLLKINTTKKITIVLKEEGELELVKERLPKDALILILNKENKEYRLLNEKTTYYICQNKVCLPAVNEL